MTATRYLCPLDCGWHYDRPQPDPTELANARPDLTSFEIAQILIAGQLQYDEKVIRDHLETHELLEWVQAVSQLKNDLAIAEKHIARGNEETGKAYARLRGTLVDRDGIGELLAKTTAVADAATAERDRLAALAAARQSVIERMARESAAAEAAVQRVRDKATEWGALASADDWGMTPSDTVLADAGRYLLALLDQPERTRARKAVTVTNHAYEGAPGAGNLCRAEAFDETCSTPWEQHAMRPES